MLTTGLLLALLVPLAWTDWRQGIIPHRILYPGIVLALILNAAASWCGCDMNSATGAGDPRWGLVGLAASGLGLLLCGGLLTVCFVYFGVGGGDVKLLALIGAWLGPYQGLSVLLWTFVLAGCFGLISIVWRVGALELASRFGRYVVTSLRFRWLAPIADERRAELKTPLRMAVAALVAVLLIRLGWLPDGT